ncbi:MAG: iron chelate uptake ABC transporter family permease subunit [Candidatus Devosia phytovorans]|uniref:Iron chelate uptake ABC transporter family permease subunit n=1 Tax=Candidatus Devosia phytovorans TaxID=3121372 RepID=A0AAJ5VX70_9HYPH|nr:iron chelate uptake ABC transporter family permease subunit [Devosia sp.]WEK06404.1 MAG: iron chelate uptake ABC transporter family permease subunit [Devosia sp.]
MTTMDAATAVSTIRNSLARRRLSITLLLTVLLLFAVGLSLYLGDYYVAPERVLQSLFSPVTGLTDRGVDFIVLNVRLPRATLAVLAGAAFALSGIIFQTLLRNPLASPDIIGISHGASASAVFCIIILGFSGVAVSLGALIGAIATALIIYGLSWRNGVTAYRVVLIGIGVAAMMAALMSYLFTRARLFEVQQSLAWLVGSLTAANVADIVPLACAMLVLLPITIALVRTLDALQLGDDTATALGARVEFARLGLMLSGVAYAAFATAAVGPVTFVAFVAGPIARNLLAGAGKGFVQAALVGALVMLGSDLIAQHALPDVQLPVGVVTGVFGAGFLLWLLIASNRAGRVN